ncbi:hypothetical protein [Dyella subtropica]|uniref:hypothetical protein n=1 Tax=Dyella subtropica TaxID=2992127 RepID=UPI0022559A4F|nr:hypothetical protein [Dyella subtropica]
MAWLGRFGFVLAWILALLFAAMLGVNLPACGEDAFGWSLLLLVLMAMYAWPLVPVLLLVAAVIASRMRREAGLWRRRLIGLAGSVMAVLVVFLLAGWLGGGAGSCHLNLW